MWKVADLQVRNDGHPDRGCALHCNDEMDHVIVTNGAMIIEIPRIAILEMVGNHVRKRMVAKWEQMTDAMVLDHLCNNS